MPNAKGGKKFKKGKKQSFHQKALIYKDPKEDQEYGKIVRAMGNGRFEVQCFDGKTRMGIIAGNMRKRVWINKDDIILFSKWGFTTDDDKCSIIHKYDIDESRKLQKEGEFPDIINLDEENENIVLKLFEDLHAQGRTIVMVTHNPDLGARTDRIIRLQHGKYIGEEVIKHA